MNISLTHELEEMVRARVAQGIYTSASEVVREALRLMDEHDRLIERRVVALEAGRPREAQLVIFPSWVKPSEPEFQRHVAKRGGRRYVQEQ